VVAAVVVVDALPAAAWADPGSEAEHPEATTARAVPLMASRRRVGRTMMRFPFPGGLAPG